MTITEAKKRCEELNKEIARIRSEYDFDSYARYVGEQKRKPLIKELNKLLLAIKKAEDKTKI